MQRVMGFLGISLFASIISLGAFVGDARAQISYQLKLKFATQLEEALGHLWAVEQDLAENDSVHALYHASHPILELYQSLKPILEEEDPELDAKFRDSFSGLIERTGPEMTPQQAKKALDEARALVEQARSKVVGLDLNNRPTFKAHVMRNLLGSSLTEYKRAVVEEEVKTVSDFQDATAFFTRSLELFERLKSRMDGKERDVAQRFYGDLAGAYKRAANPAQVESLTNGVIDRLAKSFPPDPALEAEVDATAVRKAAEMKSAKAMEEASAAPATPATPDDTAESSGSSTKRLELTPAPTSKEPAKTAAKKRLMPKLDADRGKVICRNGTVKIVQIGNDNEVCVMPAVADRLILRRRARKP